MKLDIDYIFYWVGVTDSMESMTSGTQSEKFRR